MKPWINYYLVYPGLAVLGIFFAYRLSHIPSRLETAIFMIALLVLPTLKYPKLGVYYIFCLSLFIPLFRRLYYLIGERPALDYLMLISDGVMGGLILALLLLWILNKERSRDLLSILILIYIFWLFAKVFVGEEVTTVEGLYGFKFNGLYVAFFFAGSYLLTTFRETSAILVWASWQLFLTALYGIKQILLGFSLFEQKWVDSIQFTTLRIEGVVRPFSTYVSPAAMSDGMTLLILIGVYWIIVRGRFMAPFGLMLIVSAIAPILIATVRTNWLAVLAGLVFYLGFLRIKNGWMKIAVIAVMLVGVGVYSAKGGAEGGSGSITALRVVPAKTKNLAQIMITNRTAALANPLQEYSVQKRMETWIEIIYESKFFPFGKGQGTTGYAHSYYFLILGEIGYPGLLIFLWILGLTFYRGSTVLASTQDKGLAEMMRLLLTIVFTLSILNLTGTHLHTPPGDIFFWFSLGTINRFFLQARTHRESAVPADGSRSSEGPIADGPVPGRLEPSGGARA